MRKPEHGFTLIELLVVITLIAALIAILLPSMNGARDVARRSVCASNEHQIAVGAIAYSGDNFGLLMTTFKPTGTARDPGAIGVDRAAADNEWNAHRIQPYLNGFNFTTRRCQPVFLCPNVNGDFYGWVQSQSGWASSHGFTQLPYGYFAGVDRWTNNEARNGADQQICQIRPGGGGRVLISDILLPDGNSTPYFRYNHGTGGGWGWNYVATATNYQSSQRRVAGCRFDLAPPPISGLNQAYGDGSVRWKDAGQIDTQNMYNTAAYHDGWVYRGPASPAYY